MEGKLTTRLLIIKNYTLLKPYVYGEPHIKV